MPLVSIIVPVYKAENFLPRCIESILSQTIDDIEVILVDDGSPDKSGEICDRYSQIDARIKVIHKKNGGVSSARNSGLKLASGEFVLFIDSDDYVGENYIASICSQQSDLNICGMTVRDQVGNELYSVRYENIQFRNKEEIDFSVLYQKNMLYSPYCKLFCNEIIKKNDLTFPETITWGEDGMFIADYLCHINSISIVSEVEYYYIKYFSNDTLSTKVRKDIIDMVSKSREYCINKVKEYSPRCFDAVKLVCEEDIKNNCTYFLLKLLQNPKVHRNEKEEILKEFLNNSYVQEIVLNSEKYFKYDMVIQTCLKEKKVCDILKKYDKLYRKRQIKEYLYNNVYCKMPKNIRNIYAMIKNKMKGQA